MQLSSLDGLFFIAGTSADNVLVIKHLLCALLVPAVLLSWIDLAAIVHITYTVLEGT